MSGCDDWSSYEWAMQQMVPDTATIPTPDAEVGQNGFLLNSEFNWASNGGHAHGAGVDESMHHQDPLVNYISNHSMPFCADPASLSISGPNTDIAAGSPYYSHENPANDSPFAPPHAAFSAFSNGRPTPEMASLSPSSLIGGKTDGTEDEPSTSPANYTSELPLALSPNDPNSLVPNLIALMKAAQNAPFDQSTCFESHEHARSSFQSAGPLPEDPTLPQTQRQKRAIVKEMCKAMLSLEHATDNEGMLKPFRNQKYSEERIEICCWETLEAVIMRQKSGPLLAAYEPTSKGEAETLNFAQRMTRIIECFYRHKTVCKHILDPLYLYNLVDNPMAAERRVESNKLLNRRKGHIMTAGKEALRIGQRRQPATTTPATTPKKNRRTVAQKAPRTAASRVVARNTPKTAAENKEKKPTASPADSDTSESSNAQNRIFTPLSTPEPTGSEADASPQSLVTLVPSCSSSMHTPQTMMYYPQRMVNGGPQYPLNSNITYPAHNKGYQHVYMPNVHSHRMTAPVSYSLPTADFMSNNPASYYPTGSMANLHVNSSPTPVRSAKAGRKRPSITITDELGQHSPAAKRMR